MKLTIIYQKKKLSPAARHALKDYCQRLNYYARINLIDLSKSSTRSLPTKNLIFISPFGQLISSETLSNRLADFALHGHSQLTFRLETPDDTTNYLAHWSLSHLTLSDQLSLTLLVEQLFRSFRIYHKHSYHK